MGSKRPWLLTGQLCVIELVAWGILYYAFGVFLPAMETDLGWTAATLSLGFSVALVASGLAAPAVGTWIDRRGSRVPMVAGAIAGTLGVLLWSVAASLLLYLGAWVLIGAGMAGTLYAPAFATVVRADPIKSRRAILIITVVGALASTVFLPVSGALGEWLGWRLALRVLAVVLATITIPLCLLLPTSATPRHESRTTSEAEPAPSGFRLIIVAMMVASTAAVAFNTYLIAFLVETGQPLQVAATIAALGGVAKVGGRLGTAAVDRLSALTLMRGSFFLNAAALVFPLLWPSSTAAMAMVVVVGATSGARTVLRPALIVEMFGAHNFGKKDGTLQLFTTLAKAAGPVGLGVLLAAAGTSWAWASLAVLTGASGALMLTIRPLRQPCRTGSVRIFGR